ncbi:MAG: type III-A CRISPR-associated RAMP protein Csm3 [Promethearchaeota archaeon]
MSQKEFKLKGKVQITGRIKALTGLSIGGSGGTLEIGGVDNPIIRNPITNEPYIPGSSLKGKLRSLLTLFLGKELNNKVSKKPEIWIHQCKTESDYNECPICNIFGSSEREKDDKPNFTKPTRLIVRDSLLKDGEIFSKKDLEENGDLPFSELKTEVVIDRITSQAMPRELERVPAGAEFNLELIYDIYDEKDLSYLKYLFEAMKLLEDDYLGGSGSRGSGQIEFKDIQINVKDEIYYSSGDFKEGMKNINGNKNRVQEILQDFQAIQNKIKELI